MARAGERGEAALRCALLLLSRWRCSRRLQRRISSKGASFRAPGRRRACG